MTQGRYAEAEPLLVQALDIGRKMLPEGHPRLATSLNNLARLYESQGLYAEAEPLYQRSVEDRLTVFPLGNNILDYAIDLNTLAGLYEAQGLYPKPNPVYACIRHSAQNVTGKPS